MKQTDDIFRKKRTMYDLQLRKKSPQQNAYLESYCMYNYLFYTLFTGAWLINYAIHSNKNA